MSSPSMMMSPTVDPNAERERATTSSHLLLHRHCACHGIDGAGELDQHAVAGRLGDVFGDLGDASAAKGEASDAPLDSYFRG